MFLKVAIEPQYFPPIRTFSILKRFDEVLWDVHANYQKKSYRNRCSICQVQGIMNLSVPLQKGKHQKKPLHEVKISYTENWQKQHWQSIITAYNRSPFFTYYKDELASVFFIKRDRLVTLNSDLFNWLCHQLQFKKKQSFSTEYQEVFTDEVNDYRDRILPSTDFSKFDERQKTYQQVFSDRLPFVPHLSILDLLFNMGPLAKDYI